MIVSATRLRLRRLWFLPAFIWFASKSFRQATRTPGNVTAKTRRIGLSFWTLSAWRDAVVLRDYMVNGAHGRSLPKLKDWCDEAATARWEEDEPSMTWASAEHRLRTQGRLQKVRFPSAAHAQGHPLGSATPDDGD